MPYEDVTNELQKLIASTKDYTSMTREQYLESIDNPFKLFNQSEREQYLSAKTMLPNVTTSMFSAIDDIHKAQVQEEELRRQQLEYNYNMLMEKQRRELEEAQDRKEYEGSLVGTLEGWGLPNWLANVLGYVPQKTIAPVLKVLSKGVLGLSTQFDKTIKDKLNVQEKMRISADWDKESKWEMGKDGELYHVKYGYKKPKEHPWESLTGEEANAEFNSPITEATVYKKAYKPTVDQLDALINMNPDSMLDRVIVGGSEMATHYGLMSAMGVFGGIYLGIDTYINSTINTQERIDAGEDITQQQLLWKAYGDTALVVGTQLSFKGLGKLGKNINFSKYFDTRIGEKATSAIEKIFSSNMTTNEMSLALAKVMRTFRYEEFASSIFDTAVKQAGISGTRYILTGILAKLTTDSAKDLFGDKEALISFGGMIEAMIQGAIAGGVLKAVSGIPYLKSIREYTAKMYNQNIWGQFEYQLERYVLNNPNQLGNMKRWIEYELGTIPQAIANATEAGLHGEVAKLRMDLAYYGKIKSMLDSVPEVDKSPSNKVSLLDTAKANQRPDTFEEQARGLENAVKKDLGVMNIGNPNNETLENQKAVIKIITSAGKEANTGTGVSKEQQAVFDKLKVEGKKKVDSLLSPEVLKALEVFGVSDSEPEPITVAQVPLAQEQPKADVMKPKVPLASKQDNLDTGGLVPEKSEEEKEFIRQNSSIGKTVQVSTGTGNTLEAQIMFTDLFFITGSVDEDMVKNPKFPKILQNRETDDYDAWFTVEDIAKRPDFFRLTMTELLGEGTPVIDDNGYVIAGNHRIAGFKLMMRDNPENYNKYLKYLRDNLDKFGLKQGDIFDGGVLVRMLPNGVDKIVLADISNDEDKRSFTASENARRDTKRIRNSFSKYVQNETGNIASAENVPFASAFLDSLPKSVASKYRTNDGKLNKEGVSRIENALFYEAYKSDRLLDLIATATKDSQKRLTGALLNVAPKIISHEMSVENGTSFDVNLGENISRASEEYISLEDRSSDAVELYARNIEVGDTEQTIIQKNILVGLADNNKSTKAMTEYFNTLIDTTLATGDPTQQTLFEMEIPTIQDMLKVTNERLDINEPVTRDENKPESGTVPEGEVQPPDASGGTGAEQALPQATETGAGALETKEPEQIALTEQKPVETKLEPTKPKPKTTAKPKATDKAKPKTTAKPKTKAITKPSAGASVEEKIVYELSTAEKEVKTTNTGSNLTYVYITENEKILYDKLKNKEYVSIIEFAKQAKIVGDVAIKLVESTDDTVKAKAEQIVKTASMKPEPKATKPEANANAPKTPTQDARAKSIEKITRRIDGVIRELKYDEYSVRYTTATKSGMVSLSKEQFVESLIDKGANAKQIDDLMRDGAVQVKQTMYSMTEDIDVFDGSADDFTKDIMDSLVELEKDADFQREIYGEDYGNNMWEDICP